VVWSDVTHFIERRERPELRSSVLVHDRLRSRRSPDLADLADGPPTAAGLAQLLADNEYVNGKDRRVPDAQILDAMLADIRAKTLAELQLQVTKGRIQFLPGCELRVLPDPAEYTMGKLLPTPFSSTTEAGAASA
jgi:hypothetical protein